MKKSKDNVLIILLVGLLIFCVVNIFRNLNNAIVLIANFLAIVLIFFYFFKFEEERIKKVINERRIRKYFSFDLMKQSIGYFFILILLLIILGEFFSPSWLKPFQSLIIILAVISGGLAFWLNGEKIEKEIEKENDKEKKEEDERKLNFSEKFPRVNKVPVVRSLIKWMYKEGWVYSITLILIIIIFASLGLYKLGYFEIRGDEYQVVGSATGYYRTNEFYKWDWLKNKSGKYTECIKEDKYCNYTRAWPHTFLIAQSYKIFGISEWSSRIVSLLSGIVFVILVYFISKFFFSSKNIALLGTFALALNPYFLSLFRYIRMYAILAPLFLSLIYYLYRITTESNSIKIKNNKISKIIKDNFDFNYKLLPILIILLFFNYQIHINSLMAIPSLILFIFYSAFKFKDKKYLWVSVFSLMGIILTIILVYLDIINKVTSFLTFFERKNFIYISYFSKYPFGENIGIILFVIVLFSVFLLFKKINKNKIIFIYINILFSLIFLIFIADRYSSMVYGSHIMVISILSIIFSFYYLIKTFDAKFIKIFLILLLISSVMISLIQSWKNLYGDENPSANFKLAYKTIINNFDTEKEVIFGQYLRGFYLREIADENIQIVNMFNNKKYSFEMFIEDIKKYPSGYLTWESKKRYHLENEIKKYCCDNFQQIHGSGCENIIDDFGIDIFYFHQDMIK